MSRWDCITNKEIETPMIDSFLEEIHSVFKKHGFIIEHEDIHGAFVIERYDGPCDFEWIGGAHAGTTVGDDK